MSWRERKQDVYINKGRVTTTTIKPATADGYWSVTQHVKDMGAEGSQTFEGVFTQDAADPIFNGLVIDCHAEQVTPKGNGRVAYVIEEDET